MVSLDKVCLSRCLHLQFSPSTSSSFSAICQEKLDEEWLSEIKQYHKVCQFTRIILYV